MSGGHFDYNQYRIDQMAEDIAQIIYNNDVVRVDEWETVGRHRFTQETINEFKKAVEILDKAYIYVQRIDWLVSGDDGEDNFHSRLKEELDSLKERKYN